MPTGECKVSARDEHGLSPLLQPCLGGALSLTAWRRQEGLLFSKRWGTVVEAAFSFRRRCNSSSSAVESLPVACRMRIARGEAAKLSLCHLVELGISGCPVTLCNAGCYKGKTAALTPSSPSLQVCWSRVLLCCCFSLFLSLCCAVDCFCSGGGLPLTF